MRIKKIFVFSLLLLVPNIVKADCEYKDKVRLQSLASNLSFTYEYKELDDGDRVSFDVTITNLHPELYIYDSLKNKNYYYNVDKQVTINGYEDGLVLEFPIYANSGECKGVWLITNYVNLPPYNPFYKDSVCDGVNDFKPCNKWYRFPLSYEKFVEQVTEHKENKKPIEEPTPIEDKDEVIEKVITFLSKYSFYLFGSMIVVGGSLIFYLNRKDDFDLK